MKFTIKNLGRIKNAEIDLKPLTVFVGKNGTNKTWVGYAMHALLKSFQFGPLSLRGKAAHPGRMPDDPVATFLRDAMSASGDEIKVRLVPEGTRQGAGRTLPAALFGYWFGLPTELFDGAAAVVASADDEFPASTTVVTVAADRKTAEIVVETGVGLGLHARRTVVTSQAPMDAAVLAGAVADWRNRYFENCVFFPAERNGFVSLADDPPDERVLEPLPGSVADFLSFLTASRGQPDRVRIGSPFEGNVRFARLIHGELLLGRGSDPLFQYAKAGAPTVHIRLAPSFVRTVAALDLYVRRWAASGDVIFIDELELNAHPEAQLALVEYVASLANAGVHVVFTTHSPYITDHLSNLMRASRANGHADAIASKFVLGTKDAFIKPEDVAVYRFEESDDGSEVGVMDVVDRDAAMVRNSSFAHASDETSELWNVAISAGSSR